MQSLLTPREAIQFAEGSNDGGLLQIGQEHGVLRILDKAWKNIEILARHDKALVQPRPTAAGLSG